MIRIIIGILLLLPLTSQAFEVVFEGIPNKKIETNESTSSMSPLTSEQAEEYKVTIVKDGESYYWASRGNTPVIPVQSGIYVTYIAPNGSGYVRTISPAFLKFTLASMEGEDLAEQYLYFEHLVHQLGSITYYGK
ncbi:hypothetical protein OAD22_01850 [Pseudomonadales bacterium]|nr:hypothetical protein [Pseudomonadales bacterium]MDB9868669.1 hypothetical protein [Pseudomonadales bacterium]MDB9916498.1 hypothetical protein [Pseudomonadales bacterium]MDC1308226.1 hypothetical protein [Pseudomonadales bacterium]MDC1368635.1 hypothetical protein [Pseudomonadales bacterium]